MRTLEEMIPIIDSYFGGRPEVVAAYVFGSWAKGKQRPESDVDIAVLLDRQEDIDRSILLPMFMTDLSRVLKKDAHILFLNEASYVSRMQALSHGLLAHVKDGTVLAEFRMVSLSLYLGFAPKMLEMQIGLARHIGKLYGK